MLLVVEISHIHERCLIMNARIIVRLFSLLISVSTLTSFASLALPDSDASSLQEQLFQKIKGGDLDNVKELLQMKAGLHDTNNSGSTPLHYATLFHHAEIIRFLISVGAIVNAHNKRDGNTPLRDAVDEGNEDIVKLLISAKADVNLTDEDGRSPLYAAQKAAQKKDKTAIHVALIKSLKNSKQRLNEKQKKL